MTTDARMGGGFGLLRFVAILLIAFAMGRTVTAAPIELPSSERDLITQVRSAIESKDFSVMERLVNWSDVSDYKRRMYSAQILHALGRPIGKIELDAADEKTTAELSKLKNHHLNQPVTHLLRVTYADGEPGGIEPTFVFLVGKGQDADRAAYRIVLLIKERGTTENE
ncbi:MAG: hypothetical protein ABL907_25910 [Hyphomicrobium sp.]